eukprot:scaffold1148_cov108-Isochrysis_galbana.AAC.16
MVDGAEVEHLYWCVVRKVREDVSSHAGIEGLSRLRGILHHAQAAGTPSGTAGVLRVMGMEQSPADARAAPSAFAPNDIDMGIPSSPKRPRDPAQGNMVSQRAMPIAPAMLESQPVTTECLSSDSDPARACQSLAHHTTLTGRCLKSVDT